MPAAPASFFFPCFASRTDRELAYSVGPMSAAMICCEKYISYCAWYATDPTQKACALLFVRDHSAPTWRQELLVNHAAQVVCVCAPRGLGHPLEIDDLPDVSRLVS